MGFTEGGWGGVYSWNLRWKQLLCCMDGLTEIGIKLSTWKVQCLNWALETIITILIRHDITRSASPTKNDKPRRQDNIYSRFVADNNQI